VINFSDRAGEGDWSHWCWDQATAHPTKMVSWGVWRYWQQAEVLVLGLGYWRLLFSMPS